MTVTSLEKNLSERRFNMMVTIHFLEQIKISPEKKEDLNIGNNLYKNDKTTNNDCFFEYTKQCLATEKHMRQFSKNDV